jgi:Concanavalin A-like lectin/glucanases superfamily
MGRILEQRLLVPHVEHRREPLVGRLAEPEGEVDLLHLPLALRHTARPVLASPLGSGSRVHRPSKPTTVRSATTALLAKRARMRPMRSLGAALLVAAVLAVPGCSLISLDGLTGGVGPPEAGAEEDGGEGGPPSTGYPEVVLKDGPVAYWRLDEPAGSSVAYDSTRNGNNAAYVGGVKLGVPGAIAGESDTAAQFDGLTGYVDAHNSFPFAMNAQFSLEAWVMVSSSSAYAGIISKNDELGGPPSEGFLVFVSPDAGDFGFQRLDGDNASTATSTASASTTSFLHVVATFDGLDLVLYVNGEAQGTQTAAFSIAGATADFVVGAEAGGTANYFPGTLDEVAVYDQALSANQIKTHYLAGISSNP